MNILFATSEAVPFCKTGGLADVCGSLPGRLAEQGHTVSMILPAFREALDSGQPIERTGLVLEAPIGQKKVRGELLRTRLPGTDVAVYLVDQPDYYGRDGIYQEDGEDYRDNCERFVFFSRSVFEAIRLLEMDLDVLHCHDWTTGLIPAYARTLLVGEPYLRDVGIVYTIHNLAYQGNFWHWDMALTGLDWKHFNWKELEYHGHLSFMKGGIVFADTITTVSPTYAKEILHVPLGCGMEGVLNHRAEDVFGILNGADYSNWDPEIDEHLGDRRYGVENYREGKRANKLALQAELGLPESESVPLVASVGRLADQKGLDLITRVLQQWAPREPAQWVILGTGDTKYHRLLEKLAEKFPSKLAVRLEFSNPLAHRIEAGADMFLMPSQYEPCGLNQLYSLRYGTVPVVRGTGGLADTVVQVDETNLERGVATGFLFKEYTSLALADALQRACQAYGDRGLWDRIVQTGMRQDWSWNRSAPLYGDLYEMTRSRMRRGETS